MRDINFTVLYRITAAKLKGNLKMCGLYSE